MPEPRFCNSCAVKPATMKCTGCLKAWYCSRVCQRSNWFYHKFDCKSKKAPSPDDHLVMACKLEIIPTDKPTRIIFGFERAGSTENQFNLLGLYQDLGIDHFILPKTLVRWANQGVLLEEIKKLYDAVPVNNLGDYYPWLLRNQWVLDGELTIIEDEDEKDQEDILEERGFRAGWIYAGGSPSATDQEIRDCTRKWPEYKDDCWFLCSIILTGQCPGPKSDLWVPFGFCVCSGPFGSDKRLARLYQKLLEVCTFNEFVRAYETSKLYELFASKGFAFDIHFALPLLEEFLKTAPRMSLSAWHLKQFVFDDLKEDELDCDLVPISPVMTDYGFEHCETLEDIEGLKGVYRVLLKHTSCQAPDLHRACVEGRLYEYVSSLVRMDEKEKYKQWMAAPDPLPWGYAVCCPRELRLGQTLDKS